MRFQVHLLLALFLAAGTAQGGAKLKIAKDLAKADKNEIVDVIVQSDG